MLSFCLILFNDPLYVLSVMVPTLATYILNSVFTSIFVSALLIFWLRQLMNYTKEILPRDNVFIKALKSMMTL